MAKSTISEIEKLVVAATLTLFTCSQGLLMEASKVNGKYPYNSAVVPLLSELVKLILSILLLRRARERDPAGTIMTTDVKSMLLFPIPSIIYVMHNNVQFYHDGVRGRGDVPDFRENLKIVTTGILFRFMAGRLMTRTQWIALLLLAVAELTVSQISGCKRETLSYARWRVRVRSFERVFERHRGGVYRVLLKKNNDNLYWQNVQLYAFGVVFNG